MDRGIVRIGGGIGETEATTALMPTFRVCFSPKTPSSEGSSCHRALRPQCHKASVLLKPLALLPDGNGMLASFSLRFLLPRCLAYAQKMLSMGHHRNEVLKQFQWSSMLSWLGVNCKTRQLTSVADTLTSFASSSAQVLPFNIADTPSPLSWCYLLHLS